MPLLDHFRPAPDPRQVWESFAAHWANAIVEALSRVLPRCYFADNCYQLARLVEQDVSDDGSEPDDRPAGAVLAYEPPEPGLTWPAVFADRVEVRVRDEHDCGRTVAVVALVLAGNKDSPEARRAFAAKCAAYLQRGAGLLTVDVVTTCPTNTHNELAGLLGLADGSRMPEGAALAAVAYRPARRDGANRVEAWPMPLAVGAALPLLPLPLPGGRAVPLDLEATYTRARRRATSRFAD